MKSHIRFLTFMAMCVASPTVMCDTATVVTVKPIENTFITAGGGWHDDDAEGAMIYSRTGFWDRLSDLTREMEHATDEDDYGNKTYLGGSEIVSLSEIVVPCEKFRYVSQYMVKSGSLSPVLQATVHQNEGGGTEVCILGPDSDLLSGFGPAGGWRMTQKATVQTCISL